MENSQHACYLKTYADVYACTRTFSNTIANVCYRSSVLRLIQRKTMKNYNMQRPHGARNYKDTISI